MRVRFGEFEFDAESGELRRVVGDGPVVERLQPQPARLLALLIERRGALLTRDEIRAGVWPGVEVDFDAGLHHCIRQIRSALGDTATASRYIENLPRRGYRLMVPVEAETERRVDPVAAPRRPARFVAWAAVAGVVVTALVLAGRESSTSGVRAPVRIGIMPFRPPAEASVFGDPGPIADGILEDLTGLAGSTAQIVGPTTTSAYAHQAGALARLASDYDLDYIVNARFVTDPDEPRVLAELIRTSDGAHVWVRPYTDLSRQHEIGLEISRNVAERLALGDLE